MGTAEHFVPDRVKPSFVFHTRTLWRSSPECQIARMSKITNPVWHRMLYSCIYMATVVVKGLIRTSATNSVEFTANESLARTAAFSSSSVYGNRRPGDTVKLGLSCLPSGQENAPWSSLLSLLIYAFKALANRRADKWDELTRSTASLSDQGIYTTLTISIYSATIALSTTMYSRTYATTITTTARFHQTLFILLFTVFSLKLNVRFNNSSNDNCKQRTINSWSYRFDLRSLLEWSGTRFVRIINHLSNVITIIHIRAYLY